MARTRDMIGRVRLYLARTDSLSVLVALSLIAKLLLARHYVLDTAFGLGAVVDAAALVAAVAVCSLVPEGPRRALLTSLAIALSTAMLVSVVYASYFGELPSIGMIEASGQLAQTSEATGHLLRLGYILFVVDWPILILGPAKARLLPSSSRRIVLVTAGLALLPPLIAAVVGASLLGPMNGLDYSSSLGVVAYQATSLFSLPAPAAARKMRGTFQERIDALTGHSPSSPRRPGAPRSGSMKGKNLIIVQMESLQTGLVGARVGTEAVVPNLEKLVRESIYFPNAYSQIGRGNTSDAEFVTNTSLYPASDEPSAVKYAKKALPSLPRLLAAEGYTTMTMHTNDVSFWNRDQLYAALGFETVYDKSYFGNEEWAKFGASDRILYDRTLPLLLAARSDGGPFFAQIITVSAHYPFTRTGGESPLELPEELAGTETGNYLQAQAYADAQLGKFVKRLRSSGLLEDSVLVVFGDHFGMRLDTNSADETLRETLLGHAYNAADFYNVPLIVRLPGGKPMREETVVGQIDVMPTLSDLFGLDISAVPHFGRSAFVDSPTLLTRASSVDTYISDEVAYFRGLTSGNGAYSPVTHRLLPDQDPPKGLPNARELVELSQEYARALPDRREATSTAGVIPASARKVEQTPYR